MLIRTIKFLIVAAFRLLEWTVLPLFNFAFRHSQWKGKQTEFVRAVINDPDLVEFATRTGQAGMLVMLQQKCEAMIRAPKPATEEDREWGMFIQNYGENPQPDMIPEYFRYVLRGGTTGSTELPTAGACVALCQRHADQWEQWRKVPEFMGLFEKAIEWQHADIDRPGWNDFYMVQWFILRTDELARIIAERTKLPGMVGGTCTWMANSVAQQVPAFKEALDRVGYEFPAPDMRGAVLHDAPKDDFKAAVETERRYPITQEACNEFLRTLAGATIARAEMTTLEGRNEDEDGEEHIEVITSAGMFCIVAPDLGVSFTKQTERKPVFDAPHAYFQPERNEYKVAESKGEPPC